MLMSPEATQPSDPSEAEPSLAERFCDSKVTDLLGMVRFVREFELAQTKAAKEQGLSRHHKYIIGAPKETPIEEADSVLLTPTGTQLIPGEPITHFFIYYVPGLKGDKPLPMLWIKRVDKQREETKLVLTRKDVFSYTYGEEDLYPTDAQIELPQDEAEAFFDELASYLPAPQLLNVKITDKSD
jgi:hypothetical protein